VIGPVETTAFSSGAVIYHGSTETIHRFLEPAKGCNSLHFITPDVEVEQEHERTAFLQKAFASLACIAPNAA